MTALTAQVTWATRVGGGIGEAPAHVCINEVLISPMWNRAFIGVAESGGIAL